ncbi:hypothetical protein MASR1M74_13650 [Lentimicrobium sp.]
MFIFVCRNYLFTIIKAAITPGTHPASVSRKTINTDPQPLSITAKGGKIMASITRKIDIVKKKLKKADLLVTIHLI